jgi:hypothetical protein
MAKEFNKDWNEITKLNIVTFNHKLKFVEQLHKDKLKATKVK